MQSVVFHQQSQVYHYAIEVFPDIVGMDSVTESSILWSGYIQEFQWKTIFGLDTEIRTALGLHIGT